MDKSQIGEFSILRSMSGAYSSFIKDGDSLKVIKHSLNEILIATNSSLGFIGEICLELSGKPYLEPLAKINLASVIEKGETNTAPDDCKCDEMDDWESLFRRIIETEQPVILNTICQTEGCNRSNNNSPKSKTFMAVPLFSQKKLVGIMGISNRIEGYDQSQITFLDPILNMFASMIGYIKNQAKQAMIIKELEEKNAEFESFIYRSSHDLRGPISTIKGLVNVSSIDNKKTFVHKCMEMVGECANKMDSTLVDLKDIVRIKQTELDISEIDLEAIVKMQISIFKGAKGFDSIKWNLSSVQEQPFYSDLTLVNIIIQNILDNSIKYINQVERTRIIDVDINCKEDACHLVITDNGPGISDEFLEKIFQMFFRANEGSDGKGVGLYLVKSAVDKLKGEVELFSEPNEGTSIRVFLPIHCATQITPKVALEPALN